ncbi:MAG: hypothetical protein GXX02_11780 [Syntrophomonadaceae bacterium]|nr:hypothetical protein [Syntrophomonadaceae bacterium]
MLGIREFGSVKTASLILVLLLLAVLAITRYSNVLLRFAVGQEINLKTAHFSVAETEHFKIKYTAVDQDYVPIISRASEQAYRSVSQVFGREPQGKTVIVVYPDSESLAASFGWDRDQKAMGGYWGGSIRILSPRAWIDAADAEKVFTREGPMVHEFAHLMVDEITRGNYNRWWTEGIAQYVEKNLTGFEFADPFANGRTPYYYQLDSLERSFDSLDQQVAYWQSLKIVEYLVDEYGQECLFEILEYLGQGLSMKQAVENALEVDYSSFESKVYGVLNGNGREV